MTAAQDLEKILGPKKRKTVSDLARFLNTKNTAQSCSYCFLLGAGASRSSGIRTGGELIKGWREEACRETGFAKLNGTEEEKMAHLKSTAGEWYDAANEYAAFFEHIYPIQKQRRIFIENEVANHVPSIGYAYLVRLTESNYTRTIFTTNFDDLLNEAFYQFSTERPIVCAHDSAIQVVSITSHRPKIIKLHGDYLFDWLKATSSETERLEQNTNEKLKQFLSEYGLIVSGYSGSDASVMQPLRSMLAEPNGIPYGIYWCLRSSDVVNQDVLTILKHPKAFYVIAEGFDELMAELHGLLCGPNLPFTSKIASDRASKVIASYLSNEQLLSTSSQIIRGHLDELTKERKSSLVLEAIQELRSETSDPSDITDGELLIYFDIKRLLKACDYDNAIARIKAELQTCKSTEFRKTLLEQLYYCYRRAYRRNEAIQTADSMLSLDPQNLVVYVRKCDVTLNAKTRLDLLKEAHSRSPFSGYIINRLALELKRQFEFPSNPSCAPSMKDVEQMFKRSTEIAPELSNIGWSRYFDFIAQYESDIKLRNSKLTCIIKTLLGQNPHSFRALGLLVEICSILETRQFEGRDLFSYLDEGFKKHFPRRHAEYFPILTDACIEFDEFDRLRLYQQEYAALPDLDSDEDYVLTKMQLQQDFYRDHLGAISIGEEFTKSHQANIIEEQLFSLYIQCGEVGKAKKINERLKGYLSEDEYQLNLASILELEGKNQDAVDCLKDTPDKDGFLERHTSHISYLYLVMNDYEKARLSCKELLEKHSFAFRFQREIINYEFAKSKLGKQPSKARLQAIIDQPLDKQVKAVAFILLGEKTQAMKLLEKEAEKRFSTLQQFIKWPVLAEVRPELLELQSRLLLSRRTADWQSDPSGAVAV